MSARQTKATETIGTLLVLGASGDLTARLLLPGLGEVLASGKVRPIKLIGSALSPMTPAAWKSRVRTAFKSVKATGREVDEVLKTTEYIQADITDPAALADVLAACEGTPAIYFALPPAITARTVEALQKVSIPPKTILLMEKPFGTDERSAARLNREVTKLVPEKQVYRVDHFLGKSAVLSILGMRFANRLFENSWNNQNIARIDIIADESLSLEGRAGYYDGAGALIDMIQSHLLEVMALLTMEAPATLTPIDVRDCAAQVLRATRLWNGDPVAASRRARYTAGKIGNRSVPSYVQEPGVDPSRKTETLAELTVEVRTARWAGVPITLRSGKAIGAQRSEAVINFAPLPLIPEGFGGATDANVLRLDLSADARVALGINLNGPGDPRVLDRVELQADPGPGEFVPYAEVIFGALNGDPTFTVRGDVAEQCWRVVDPVLRAWRADKVPLQSYRAGSGGPKGWQA
jgi:glucose-6-phosphate 1-dehydrogenase